jgi:hypothetical protein
MIDEMFIKEMENAELNKKYWFRRYFCFSYGLKELTIDSPYITSLEHAEKIAKFIIDKMSEPVPIVNISIMAIPTIQLGDRIKIGSLDAFDIIDGEYWVTSQEFSYGESISHSLILRKVV